MYVYIYMDYIWIGGLDMFIVYICLYHPNADTGGLLVLYSHWLPSAQPRRADPPGVQRFSQRTQAPLTPGISQPNFLVTSTPEVINTLQI